MKKTESQKKSTQDSTKSKVRTKTPKAKMTVADNRKKKALAKAAPEKVDNKYEDRLVHLIDEAEEKIKFMKSQGKVLSENAKEKLSDRWDHLKDKNSDLSKKFEAVKESTTEKWQDLQENTDKKLSGLEKEAVEVVKGIKGGFKYLLAKIRK